MRSLRRGTKMKSTPYWHECKSCHHKLVIDLCDNQEAPNKQCPMCETQEALVKGKEYERKI